MGKGTNSALHAISDKSAANKSPTSTTIPSIFKSGNILEQHSLLSKGADDDGESRINAFCFPHAGGASHSFAKWEAPMRSVGIRINAATYPGRGSRFMEPAAQSMSQIVQDCLAWMVPEMDRPFILLGHSLGGLVAFEVLRELEAAVATANRHYNIQRGTLIMVRRKQKLRATGASRQRRVCIQSFTERLVSPGSCQPRRGDSSSDGLHAKG